MRIGVAVARRERGSGRGDSKSFAGFNSATGLPRPVGDAQWKWPERVMIGPAFVSRSAAVSLAHVRDYHETKLSGRRIILSSPSRVHGNSWFFRKAENPRQRACWAGLPALNGAQPAIGPASRRASRLVRGS